MVGKRVGMATGEAEGATEAEPRWHLMGEGEAATLTKPALQTQLMAPVKGAAEFAGQAEQPDAPAMLLKVLLGQMAHTWVPWMPAK